ncbi:MAG: hypothetical protein AAB390_05265 [Patescibacteria group bacterium]
MMLTLRQRIFLIIGAIMAVLAIILSAGYFFTARKSATAPATEESAEAEVTPAVKSAPSVNGNGVTIKSPPVSSPAGANDVYFRQLATVFVERFSSYSNQNDNKHIADSLILATPSMRAWMERQALTQSAEFAGVTTKVVSATSQTKDKDKAVISFRAQQVVENKTAAENVVRKEIIQRSGRVELVKVGSDWLVNGLWWE